MDQDSEAATGPSRFKVSAKEKQVCEARFTIHSTNHTVSVYDLFLDRFLYSRLRLGKPWGLFSPLLTSNHTKRPTIITGISSLLRGSVHQHMITSGERRINVLSCRLNPSQCATRN